MKNRSLLGIWTCCAVAALTLVYPLAAIAQTESGAQARRPAAAPSAAMQPPTDQDVAAIQDQLLHLLRLSPVLTTVVARDPSLLADQAYVARNNPELAQFLASHPDVARNPDLYLFSHLDPGGGRRDQALDRVVWPEFGSQYKPSQASEILDKLMPLIVLPCLFLAVVWIIRLFVESHRWSRTFKQQSEIHARLIDKFSSSQDLAAYMETEAGKRFLEMSPIASGPQAGPHMPNVVARVLTPLQLGVVMTLLGIGFYFLRNAGPDMTMPMTILGTLALMPGIGFILSAGATWIVAQRLGLMPDKADAHNNAGAPLGRSDGQ